MSQWGSDPIRFILLRKAEQLEFYPRGCRCCNIESRPGKGSSVCKLIKKLILMGTYVY
jgi:hypothetical protein